MKKEYAKAATYFELMESRGLGGDRIAYERASKGIEVLEHVAHLMELDHIVMPSIERFLEEKRTS